MNFTKGTWAADEHNWVTDETGRIIANCTFYNREEGAANCRLIAAAPALVKVLTDFLDDYTLRFEGTPDDDLPDFYKEGKQLYREVMGKEYQLIDPNGEEIR